MACEEVFELTHPTHSFYMSRTFDDTDVSTFVFKADKIDHDLFYKNKWISGLDVEKHIDGVDSYTDSVIYYLRRKWKQSKPLFIMNVVSYGVMISWLVEVLLR